MSAAPRAPRLVIVCVDGGQPATVREHGFFDLTRVLGRPQPGVNAMRTVFPSSTAPAHASLLTGCGPAGHGIVGNRFWSLEPVAGIRSAALDPLASLHAYEAASLTAPSVLDDLAAVGVRVIAVHFPHTFARAGEAGALGPSLFCLYAPARSAVPRPAGSTPASTETLYFRHPVRISLWRRGHAGLELQLCSAAGASPVVPVGTRPTAIEVPLPVGRLSAAVTVSENGDGSVTVLLGTAGLVMPAGRVAADVLGRLGPACSATPSYDVGWDTAFHETPSVSWVRDAALALAAAGQPDVLLVRFNQADHAQENVYWLAARGSGAESDRARALIIGAYAAIDQAVREIAAEFGPDTRYLIFSDHGIDHVDQHIRPNAILAGLGWDDRMIIQGDSNVAYLYAQSPPRRQERERLAAELALLGVPAWVATHQEVRRAGLPAGHPRLGHLVLMCGRHCEFQYSPGPPVVQVQAASHGFGPAGPAMRGFVRLAGPGTQRIRPPMAIAGAAHTIRELWLSASSGIGAA